MFVTMLNYYNAVARAWQEPYANGDRKTKWNGKKRNMGEFEK
jgi:hypothetical protein